MHTNYTRKQQTTPRWASDVPDNQIKWFYPDVFIRGELNGVQGIPGDGKSWLMCELAAKTSTGGEVQCITDEFDTVNLPYGNVLYLSGDDAPELLKKRFQLCGADLNNIAFAPEGTLPQIGSAELETLFKEVRPTLCVIDTLQHFIYGASSNSMTSMTIALQPLQKIARSYNTTVIIIMHTSKSAAKGNGGDSTGFYIGSYAIAGIFRTLWTLGRMRDENRKPLPTRALCLSKNNYVESDPPALLFELENGFHWCGIDHDLTAEDLYNKNASRGRPPEKREEAKLVVLKILEDMEKIPSTELEQLVIEETGCHANTVTAAKKDIGVKSVQSGGQWYSTLE